MEEKQNKNNPQNSSSTSSKNPEEEKELLKESRILIRDQGGKFSYLKGASLLGEEISPTAPSIPLEKRTEIKQVTASSVRSPLVDLKRPSGKLTASFYIDAEDEEEIQKLYDERIGKAATAINYDSIIEEIKKVTGVSFADELLARRFSSLVNSRLRDIRTSYQLKELLTRSRKVGGLELPPEKSDEVVKITEEKAKTLHDQKTIQELAERKKKKEQEAQKDETEQAKIRQAIAREQIKKALETLHEKAVPAFEPSPPLPPPRVSVKKVSFPSLPQVKRPSWETEGKTKVVDIKIPKRLLGPVEEIRSITLEDFRRAGSTTGAIKKVKEKIDLLEEESFTKKAEGIQAWRQSEIYQLYLDIGNESMNKGKSVEEIIASRIVEGRSHLTFEEFRAMGDLNKELRF